MHAVTLHSLKLVLYRSDIGIKCLSDFTGSDGGDTINGGTGIDTITGGGGSDDIDLGTGDFNDIYTMTGSRVAQDTIENFGLAGDGVTIAQVAGGTAYDMEGTATS